MKVSRIVANPKGQGKKLERVYGIGISWPMAFRRSQFRRGPYISKFVVVGFLRFYTYDQAVKAKA